MAEYPTAIVCPTCKGHLNHVPGDRLQLKCPACGATFNEREYLRAVQAEAGAFSGPPVTLSGDEAQRLLNLLRTVQMNLSQTAQATHPVEREANPLFSNEFAGELHALITGLEGSIYEAGAVRPTFLDAPESPN